MATPLAGVSDVEDVWRPITEPVERARVGNLIVKASARLRQKAPFDIDARIALFTTTPTDPTALDPGIVADVVATAVKRFLVNADGVVSESNGVGPFSESRTFVSRYDKTGADTRGGVQITDSDIEQLRPAVPTPIPATIHVVIPQPSVLVPRGFLGPNGRSQPAVIPDVYLGSGNE